MAKFEVRDRSWANIKLGEVEAANSDLALKNARRLFGRTVHVEPIDR